MSTEIGLNIHMNDEKLIWESYQKQILKESDKTQKLYLIRGISGSGKSTYAQKLLSVDPSIKHFEADMFFKRNGNYNFNPSLLKDAHKWCFDKTEEALRNGHSVIVSNTFTQNWEIKPYIDLGKKYGVEIIIKKATGNYKNIHGVPEEALKRMKDRWENVESETGLYENPFAVFVVAKLGTDMVAGTTRAADRNESGRIGLPGGKIDAGEDPVTAAIRESEEEGWKVEIVNKTPIHQDIVDGRVVWWYEGINPVKLTDYKEKNRITPIPCRIEDILKSGYGNENLNKYFSSI